ncbi:MAG: GAF domain-containing protein, partial [Synergistaceae bacterium]
WGLERDIRGTISLSLADGVCGKVFSSAIGELITESHRMQMFFKDIKSFMDLIRYDESSRPLMPTSSIVVPIISESAPIGVLAAIEFSPQHMYSSQHIAYFATIAKSLALRKKFEKMQNENAFMHEEISLLESVLKRDSDQTALAGLLSASMSALFLRGKEFDEMIELAARHVAFPIALYNMFLERLHCTENAISRTLPGNILELINLHGLIHKKDWQTLPQENEFFCLIPIHFGGIMRGFLVAWIPSGELKPKDRTVLECLSFYLSFVWIKKAAVHEKNQNLKSEILSGILSGKNDDSLLAKANALGLSGGNKFFVLMVAVPNIENHMVYSDKQECACLVYCIESILGKKQMSCIIVPEHND